MDLRIYYQKMRQLENELPENPVVVSLETPDGGKAGVRSEVTRPIAARLILDGRARLAQDAEAVAFREEQAEAQRIAEEMAAARRVQMMLVPSGDWRAPITTAQLSKE